MSDTKIQYINVLVLEICGLISWNLQSKWLPFLLISLESSWNAFVFGKKLTFYDFKFLT